MVCEQMVDYRKLKLRVSITDIVEFYEIKLTQEGENLWGDCPLCYGVHDPIRYRKLRVTPSKSLWTCLGCDAGGNTIDFVAALEGVSAAEAAIMIVGAFEIADCFIKPPHEGGKNNRKSMQSLRQREYATDESATPDTEEIPTQH